MDLLETELLKFSNPKNVVSWMKNLSSNYPSNLYFSVTMNERNLCIVWEKNILFIRNSIFF